MYVSPVANRTCFVEVNVSSLRTLRGFLSKTRELGVVCAAYHSEYKTWYRAIVKAVLSSTQVRRKGAIDPIPSIPE